MRHAPLVILSGPSGAGKSTLIRRLLSADLPLRLSVSATTRSKRPREVDGVDYHFLSTAELEEGIARGEFLEHAIVHGKYYGTPREEVFPYLEKGVGVILDIDVQGFDQVREKVEEYVSIFVRPSLFEILEQRLRQRGTESEAVIERRLRRAKEELARAEEYQYQVINDDSDHATEEILHILRGHYPDA